MEIRRLRPEDDRASFRSGNDDLDRFFHRFAGQNQFRHHVGTTYVAVDAGSIVGFATVSASQLIAVELPDDVGSNLPRYPLPVLRLARLAVAGGTQGRGIGLSLLKHVLTLARRMADEVGCVGVVVDAKPDAVPFYERLGFHPLELRAGHLGDRPQPIALFLELEAIPSLRGRPRPGPARRRGRGGSGR